MAVAASAIATPRCLRHSQIVTPTINVTPRIAITIVMRAGSFDHLIDVWSDTHEPGRRAVGAPIWLFGDPCPPPCAEFSRPDLRQPDLTTPNRLNRDSASRHCSCLRGVRQRRRRRVSGCPIYRDCTILCVSGVA